MSVIYGKVRIHGDAGQTITITTPKGTTQIVQTTGQNFTDIALVGMEEYNFNNGYRNEDIILNVNDFKEIDMPFRLLLKKIPYEFYNGSVVVFNNEIHILGCDSYSLRHYKFDGTNWVSVSTLPFQINGGNCKSTVVYQNEIHIFNNQQHYKFDGTDWISVSTPPFSLARAISVVYNNEIHVLGNFDSSYDKRHYKWNGSSWSSVSTLPYSTSNKSNAVVFNNEIHLLYGDSNKRHYKWNGSSWSSVSTLPFNFYYGCAVVYNNEIHIMGSSYYSSGYPYETSHYKWNGSSWTSVSTLPYGLMYGSTVVSNDEIYILGTDKNSYRTYDAQWDGTSWTIGANNN